MPPALVARLPPIWHEPSAVRLRGKKRSAAAAASAATHAAAAAAAVAAVVAAKPTRGLAMLAAHLAEQAGTATGAQALALLADFEAEGRARVVASEQRKRAHLNALFRLPSADAAAAVATAAFDAALAWSRDALDLLSAPGAPPPPTLVSGESDLSAPAPSHPPPARGPQPGLGGLVSRSPSASLLSDAQAALP